eukprot:PhF_6_TR11513/c1_g1_i2/m.18420
MLQRINTLIAQEEHDVALKEVNVLLQRLSSSSKTTGKKIIESDEEYDNRTTTVICYAYAAQCHGAKARYVDAIQFGNKVAQYASSSSSVVPSLPYTVKLLLLDAINLIGYSWYQRALAIPNRITSPKGRKEFITLCELSLQGYEREVHVRKLLNHPTQDTTYSIANLLTNMGRYEEAKELFYVLGAGKAVKAVLKKQKNQHLMNAATTVQRMVRGYLCRVRVRRKRECIYAAVVSAIGICVKVVALLRPKALVPPPPPPVPAVPPPVPSAEISSAPSPRTTTTTTHTPPQPSVVIVGEELGSRASSVGEKTYTPPPVQSEAQSQQLQTTSTETHPMMNCQGMSDQELDDLVEKELSKGNTNNNNTFRSSSSSSMGPRALSPEDVRRIIQEEMDRLEAET